MGKRRWIIASALAAGLALAPGLTAQGRGQAISIRAGMPTDVVVNLGSLYSFGASIDGGIAWQVLDWLIAGAEAGYGLGIGSSSAVPDLNSYVNLAARLGVGRIGGLSVSVLAGAVWVPLGDIPIYPDLGLELDWGFASLLVSSGTLSVGVNLPLGR
jgi:hypothetical protein